MVRKGDRKRYHDEEAGRAAAGNSEESDSMTRRRLLDDPTNTAAAAAEEPPNAAEGRRCALCGEAKELRESENVKPDCTVGRSGLGRLLGPLSDRMGVAAVWVHQECAVWSPEVYFLGVGCLKNVKAALRRGRFLKCSRCGQPGATIGCRVSRCPRTYHLPCARVSGCSFNHKRYLMSCAEHVNRFHIQDKKRLRECMIGVWDDQHAKKPPKDRREDKVVDNAEDEEFLKRERKRLQRDLAHLAPVKVGGSSIQTSSLDGWDSVGGLQNVVECLKEMVTLPLLYPEVFQKIGIVPPRGVLLHGYPGTGKTLVVRALLGACARGEQQIAFFSRKGADCLGKYVGDSERQLRLLFQLAEQAQPSIIFFDELDGLAPKRSRNQDQTLSSVVSTLLALMDGLNPRGSVVVIGATNRPDALDPALRRAGRFDREIFFPLPSAADREAILAVHTKSWNKPPSRELLTAISKSTVGYAGADLQAVCAQAAMVALRRAVCVQDLLKRNCGSDILPELQVRTCDWITALAHSGPPCARRMIGSALSEVHISPLPHHLVHALLRPVVLVFLHLDSDGRFFLPPHLKKPLALAKEMFRQIESASSTAASEDLENACRGTGMFTDDDLRADEDDDSLRRVAMRPLVNGWKVGSFRILLTGAQKDGKSLVAASVLHVLQSSMQVFVLSIQTMIQAGSGDLLEGLIRILESARAVSSVLFMPQIDSWALVKETVEQEELLVSSNAWSTFLQQTGSLPLQFPVLFLATCEEKQLPLDVSSFFSASSETSKDTYCSRACIKTSMPTESDVKEVFKRAAKTIINGLALRGRTRERRLPGAVDLSKLRAETKAAPLTSQQHQETPKERNALLDAVRYCGYQLLNSPHITSLRQATTRLGAGPSLYLEDSYSGLWVIKDPIPQTAGKLIDTSDSQRPEPSNAETIAQDQDATETPAETIAQETTEAERPADSKTETETNHERIVKRFLDALGPEEDDELKDENRRIWGLEAVGMKACKGFYRSGLELVAELKSVVELLRQRLEQKFKARKRRWHCCQLLTQAAALQDLMECWIHELRRLESRERPGRTQPSEYPPPDGTESSLEKPETQDDGFNEQQKVECPPVVLSYVEVVNLFSSKWEKHGRSFMIEDIHDIVSETSAQLFSQAC